MTINIWLDNDIGLYSVQAESDAKDVILECLSESEVNELKIGEIKRLMEG